MAESPKRRKCKDNPYTLNYIEEKNIYTITFKDVKGHLNKVEVSEEVYRVFDKFELQDIKELNEYDRHIEHSEIFENNLESRALVVDVDPQSNLTTYAGWYDENELKYTLTDLMEQSMNDEEIKTKESILHHSENVDLIPSNLSLSALENSLTYAMSREYTLRNNISFI